jgi:hypothetical protein
MRRSKLLDHPVGEGEEHPPYDGAFAIDRGYQRLWVRWNNRRTCPVFRKNLKKQYVERQVCLILSGMCEVPRFKEIVPSLVDRRSPALSEGDFAGKHIPNPGPNVVMHSEVGPRGKRQFGGSQFELIVKLSQMAEDHLFEFDF